MDVQHVLLQYFDTDGQKQCGKAVHRSWENSLNLLAATTKFK